MMQVGMTHQEKFQSEFGHAVVSCLVARRHLTALV